MNEDVQVLGYYVEADIYSWKVVREHIGNQGKSKGAVQKSVLGYYKSRENAYKNLLEYLIKSELEGEKLSAGQVEYLNKIVSDTKRWLGGAIGREVHD